MNGQLNAAEVQAKVQKEYVINFGKRTFGKNYEMKKISFLKGGLLLIDWYYMSSLLSAREIIIIWIIYNTLDCMRY